MADPAALKRSRAGHTAVATRRMKKVADTFAASPDPDLLRLEKLKCSLQDTFDTLKRLDEELIVHVDAADVNREIEDSEHTKDEMWIKQ